MHSDRKYLNECMPFCGVSLWVSYTGPLDDVLDLGIIHDVWALQPRKTKQMKKVYFLICYLHGWTDKKVLPAVTFSFQFGLLEGKSSQEVILASLSEYRNNLHYTSFLLYCSEIMAMFQLFLHVGTLHWLSVFYVWFTVLYHSNYWFRNKVQWRML